MNVQKNSVANWLEIAAHIGIVVGLLLVAFQIAQEDDIAETEVIGQLYSNVIDHYEKLAGENPAESLARAIDDPQSLTPEDHVILFNLYMTEFAKEMRREAMPGYKIMPSAVARWSGLTGNPYGYAWWKTSGKFISQFVPQLSAELEKELARLGPLHANQTSQTHQEIHDLMLELKKP